MFKPVSGEALNQFDEETRELYSKKTHDPRLSYILSVIPRKNRYNLPVIVDAENNQYLKEMESTVNRFKWNYLAQMSFFTFACYQFQKAYYPFGIIVRRSVPTTMAKQAGFYLPMMAFFTYAWWMHKEHPRKHRMDLTSDEE